MAAVNDQGSEETRTTFSGCSPTLTAADPIGRRTSVCDAAGWETWSYDSRGHVIAERRDTNSVTKSTAYTYNFHGGVTSITYPSGRTVSSTYNADAYLSIPDSFLACQDVTKSFIILGGEEVYQRKPPKLAVFLFLAHLLMRRLLDRSFPHRLFCTPKRIALAEYSSHLFRSQRHHARGR